MHFHLFSSAKTKTICSPPNTISFLGVESCSLSSAFAVVAFPKSPNLCHLQQGLGSLDLPLLCLEELFPAEASCSVQSPRGRPSPRSALYVGTGGTGPNPDLA